MYIRAGIPSLASAVQIIEHAVLLRLGLLLGALLSSEADVNAPL